MPTPELVKPTDYLRIEELFCEAFDAETPHPDYVKNLGVNAPECAFVVRIDDDVVAYAFGHKAGSIGYIGTVAVTKEERGNGYGRALTCAVRDALAETCSVVGLAVEPNLGRNLELYTSCGFEPVLPSGFFYKKLEPAQRPAQVTTFAELGPDSAAAIEQVASWSSEVLPGLDFTTDLTDFAARYADRVWLFQDEDGPRGVMAYEESFRGDMWGMVRPGPGDGECFQALVRAMEADLDEPHLILHLQTTFPRTIELVRALGYRTVAHKTCMIHAGGSWPHQSEALFVRPWWT